MKVYLDFETRSRVDLKTVGAIAYAMHPSTEIMCMGIGSGGKVLNVWPANRLEEGKVLWSLALERADKTIVEAHNAIFECAIYEHILHRRHGWPALREPSQWSCTMARAAACGLPMDLASLTEVLGCKTPKDLEGRRVMQQLCRPRKDGTFDETPEKLQRLYEYNKTDLLAEMEVDSSLPELPPGERAVWELDLVANLRGVCLDLVFARAAARLSEELVDGLNRQLRDLTGGVVDKATRVAAIKHYLKERHNVTVDSLDKVGVTELLANPRTTPAVRSVVSIRSQVGKSTSTAKYAKAVEMACPSDGRVRGILQYHAAHTGRFGGRLLQPQNFPQGFDEQEQGSVVELVKSANGAGAGLLSLVYGDKAMDALSDSVRGLIVAAPGAELYCADYNAIEARVLFWLAGEEGALAAYRRGESPYAEMAYQIYPNLPSGKGVKELKHDHPPEYDLAKRTVLGAGYGMGAKKFRDNIYAETAKKGIPLVVSEDLAQRAVRAYRERYRRVVMLWSEIEQAAIEAVRHPDKRYAAAAGSRLLWGVSRDRRFLCCRLPSGRLLRYWKPEVTVGSTPWGEQKEMLLYWGVDSQTKQWTRLKTYGGALTENATQAVARDLIVNGAINCERSGYPVLFTVHDELLAERKKGTGGTLDEYVKLMCALPPWANGLPVAAEGWVGERYRK